MAGRDYTGCGKSILRVAVVPQRLNSLLKNPVFDVQSLKGLSDFEELTASLKRCPDTKREFFSKLQSRH